MSFFLSARRLRPLVALAAVAVPLVGAGSASAAMAGANPLTTTNRPDLRSVTITSDSSARFCFDKNITQTPDPARFILGGYRFDNLLASTAAPTIAGQCVNATFPIFLGEQDDLPQSSFGQVAEGAVQRAVGPALVNNRADSTALIGSTSHNGTRGLTTGPDLQAVTVTNFGGANELSFVYDQKVQASSVVPNQFAFYTATGAVVVSTSAQASGNTVRAQFPSSPSAAVRAFTILGVKSQTSDHTSVLVDAAPVGGSSGDVTNAPGLLSATLSIDGTFVDYTFDRPVTPAAMAANYLIYTSDGGILNNGTINATQPSPNVVRVNVAASTFHEYIVKVAVLPGAATETVPAGVGPLNTVGSAPVGGNAGAFASGFATGPDAFRVTFDKAGNTATVLFDQRVFGPTTPGSFVLLDANGDPLPGGTGQSASSASLVGPPVAGSFNVTVTFTGASVANAKALEIRGPGETAAAAAAVRTSTLKPQSIPPGAPNMAGGQAPNVQQIVSPTATALTRRHGRVVWKHIAVRKNAKASSIARLLRHRSR